MAIYNTIYSFEVFDKINEGKNVFVTDRQNRSVALINDMDVESAVRVVNAENRTRRYEFWIEGAEETEE